VRICWPRILFAINLEKDFGVCKQQLLHTARFCVRRSGSCNSNGIEFIIR